MHISVFYALFCLQSCCCPLSSPKRRSFYKMAPLFYLYLQFCFFTCWCLPRSRRRLVGFHGIPKSICVKLSDVIWIKNKNKSPEKDGGHNKVTGKNKIVLLHPWSLSCKKAKESRPSEGFSLSEGLKRQTGATQMSQIFIPITSKTWEGAELGSWVGGAGTRRSTTKHQCSSCWTPKTEIRRRNLESCCWSQLDQEDSGSILFIL